MIKTLRPKRRREPLCPQILIVQNECFFLRWTLHKPYFSNFCTSFLRTRNELDIDKMSKTKVFLVLGGLNETEHGDFSRFWDRSKNVIFGFLGVEKLIKIFISSSRIIQNFEKIDLQN